MVTSALDVTTKISMDLIWVSSSDNIKPRQVDLCEISSFRLAGRSRVMLETASIAGGAVIAMLLFFIIGFFVYLKKHTKKNEEFEVESQKQICEKF